MTIVRLACPDGETACGDREDHCCCMGCDGEGWIEVAKHSEHARRIRAKPAEQEAWR